MGLAIGCMTGLCKVSQAVEWALLGELFSIISYKINFLFLEIVEKVEIVEVLGEWVKKRYEMYFRIHYITSRICTTWTIFQAF